MQGVVKTANLLKEIIDFSRLFVRVGSCRKVLWLLLLEHSYQLENFLVLLILCLVVNGQLSLSLFDVFFEEAPFIVRSNDVSAHSLHFKFFLIQHGLWVHDVTIDCITVLAKIGVVTFESLKFFLKNFCVSSLLLNLLFEVLTHVPDTILHLASAWLYFSNSHPERFVHRVKICTVLELATVRVNDRIMYGFCIFNCRALLSLRSLPVLIGSSMRGRAVSNKLVAVFFLFMHGCCYLVELLVWVTRSSSRIVQIHLMLWLFPVDLASYILGFLERRVRNDAVSSSISVYHSVLIDIRVTFGGSSLRRTVVFFVTVTTRWVYEHLLSWTSSSLLKYFLCLFKLGLQVWRHVGASAVFGMVFSRITACVIPVSPSKVSLATFM